MVLKFSILVTIVITDFILASQAPTKPFLTESNELGQNRRTVFETTHIILRALLSLLVTCAICLKLD